MRVPGKLQRNTCSLRNFRMVGRVQQQNTGALAIEAHAVQRRRQLATRGVPVRHAKNLQSVYFYLLAAQHAHPGRRNGTQVFAVVPKLFMIFPRPKYTPCGAVSLFKGSAARPASMAVPSYKSPAIKTASGSSCKIFATRAEGNCRCARAPDAHR